MARIEDPADEIPAPVVIVPWDGLPGRDAPDKESKPLLHLPGGTRVRVLDSVGSWANVTTPAGFSTWVDKRRLIQAHRPALDAFCTACGGVDENLACPISHDASPASDDIGLGRVVTYRRGLRRRSGVVVGRTMVGGKHGYRMIEEHQTEQVVRAEVRDDAPQDGAAPRSPLRRLEALAERPEWAAGLTQWISAHREELLARVGDRRLYAHDALSSGDAERAETAGLPETEVTWLSMHAHRRSGRLRGAFAAAITLPPKRYPDHALVLLEAISDHRELIEYPGLGAHVEELDSDFVGAKTLRVIVGSDPDLAAAAAELDVLAGTSVAPEVERVMGGQDAPGALAGPDLERPSPDRVDPGVGERRRRAQLWPRIASGDSISATELGIVYEQHPAVADDLIDSARIDDAASLDDVQSTYLRARLSIETLSEDELREVGAVGELARRFYEKRDASALESLAVEAPEAEYYVALDALRRGEIPSDIPDQPLLRAVASSLESRKVQPDALVDPSVWAVLDDLITDEDAALYPHHAAVWHLNRALDDVFAWRFDSALDRARLVLKASADERIRDEALNVTAFALYQRGDDEPAIVALEKALEDDYSANLQANIGIVAESLRPDLAAAHLATLAKEAPTLELQLEAVRHAFGIWAASPNAWDEDAITVPAALLATMRTLVISDIPYPHYVQLVQFLAGADAAWLARGSNTDAGPHAASSARRVYVARASHEPRDYVRALAAESKRGNADEWLVNEIASFIENLRDLMFTNLGEAIGPASYAFEAIDAGLELDHFDYVTLSCGAALSIFGAIAEKGGEPSDRVREMLVEARRRVELLDADAKERIQRIVDMAGDGYGVSVGQFHASIHDQIIDALQPLAMQLYGVPRHRVKWYEVERGLRPMMDQAVESAMAVRAATEFVTDPDLRQRLLGLASALDDLILKLGNPRSSF